MTEHERSERAWIRPEQQGDGQPENLEELEDSGGGTAIPELERTSRRAREQPDTPPESAMGGTSDAGTAADDAAEAAALRRGLPNDKTK